MIIRHAVPEWDGLDIRTLLLQLCYPYDIRRIRVRLFSLLLLCLDELHTRTTHTSANHTAVCSVRYIRCTESKLLIK